MRKIRFIDAEEKYIKSFWIAFDTIAAEKKYLGTARAFPLDITTKFLRRSINKKVPYIFAVRENKVIGWCDLQPKDNITAALGIALIKEYRNLGIGTVLIHKVFEKGMKYGFKKIFLEVRKSNKVALEFYEKLGFKKINVIEEGVKIGNMKDDVIQMEKEL